MNDNSLGKEMYNKAYNLHYNESNLEEAFNLYNRVINEHPNSEEANYAKAQIENIEGKLRSFGGSFEQLKSHTEEKRRLNKEDQLIYNPPVILTTAQSLEGFKVIETIEVITAECVYGINILFEFVTELTDFFGGRSGTTQDILRNARKNCLSELKREAHKLGANAVIAVDLDYSEFTGRGKSMLFLVASGTAVKVEKVE